MLGIEKANGVLMNGDGVLAIHVDAKDLPHNDFNPIFQRLEKTAVIILVDSGTVDAEIDYHVHRSDPDDGNVIILGNFNVIGECSVSDDFSADVLIISKKFIMKILPENSQGPMLLPVRNMIAMRDRPVLHLEPSEKTLVQRVFRKICRNVSRHGAPLRLHLLYVSVVEFMLELMNLILPRYVGPELQRRKDRKRNIVDEFAKLLLDNFRKEHSVAFYAGKLFISPQYLTKACNAVLGVPANRVIDDMLMTEARIMLRKPNVPMQQIALDLGFSDQSSFGKFFRKEQGISPMAYRKQL